MKTTIIITKKRKIEYDSPEEKAAALKLKELNAKLRNEGKQPAERPLDKSIQKVLLGATRAVCASKLKETITKEILRLELISYIRDSAFPSSFYKVTELDIDKFLKKFLTTKDGLRLFEASDKTEDSKGEP